MLIMRPRGSAEALEDRRHRALEEADLAGHQTTTARLGAHLVFIDESGFLLIPVHVGSISLLIWGECRLLGEASYATRFSRSNVFPLV
jgi:hypothetical protein